MVSKNKKQPRGNAKVEIRLVVLRGESQGKYFLIEEGDNLIGRWDPDKGAFPEIDLELEDIDSKISRRHAMLRRKGGKVVLIDIGSLNGTFVNRGPRLKEGVEVELKSADEVIVGKTFLRFEITKS